MLDELLGQGVRYIENAQFVRDHFIAVAVAHERWNIVVYEAHRATELLVRGMICQVGAKPQAHHDIRRHISFLQDRLPGAKLAVIPFIIGAYTKNGGGYGIVLSGQSGKSLVRLLTVHGAFTLLGQTLIDLPISGRIKLKFDLRPPYISVHFDNTCVLTTTDSTYTGPFEVIDRTFVRQPDKEKIKLLKGWGDTLTRTRDLAYYEEKVYGRDDALHAMASMQKSFDIAAAFFSFE